MAKNPPRIVQMDSVDYLSLPSNELPMMHYKLLFLDVAPKIMQTRS